MTNLPLTVESETARLITFNWTPVPCVGYVFYVNDIRVANSWDPLKSRIRFNKVPNGVYRVDAVEITARGVYPPPVSNEEDYSDEPYGVGVYSH